MNCASPPSLLYLVSRVPTKYYAHRASPKGATNSSSNIIFTPFIVFLIYDVGKPPTGFMVARCSWIRCDFFWVVSCLVVYRKLCSSLQLSTTSKKNQSFVTRRWSWNQQTANTMISEYIHYSTFTAALYSEWSSAYTKYSVFCILCQHKLGEMAGAEERNLSLLRNRAFVAHKHTLRTGYLGCLCEY